MNNPDMGRPVPVHATPTAHCSICGKSEDDVEEMYLGNERWLICSECIGKQGEVHD